MSHPIWQICRKHNISPNQLYFLDSCKEGIVPAKVINSDNEKLTAVARGWLKDNQITKPGLDILTEFESLVIKKKAVNAKKVLGEDYLKRIKEYRELFPKGTLPSGAASKQSVSELTKKFIIFFQENPEYNWDIILDATEYYLYTKALVNFEYTVTSSYFIKKTDPRSKEESSKLADYCQMIIDDPKLLDY